MIKENKLGLVWADQEDKEKEIKRCVDDYLMCLPASHDDLEIQEFDKEIESLYEKESLLTANVYAHAKKKIIDLQNASAPLVKGIFLYKRCRGILEVNDFFLCMGIHICS